MYGNLMMYFRPEDTLPMETLGQCPVCSQPLDQLSSLNRIDIDAIYLHDLAPGSEIIMCGCGLVLQRRRLAQKGWADYNEAFPTDGKTGWDKDGFRFEPELNNLTHYCGNQAAVLDVGCGFGELTKLLKDRGYQAEGTDIRKSALDYGRKAHGLVLHQGFYNAKTAQAMGCRFDAIISVHAFEHFHDPLATLQAMRLNLRDGGFVFLTVPDTEPFRDPDKSLGTKPQTDTGNRKDTGANNGPNGPIVDGMPFDFFTSGHPFYYDRITLGYILKRCGFDLVTIERGNDNVSERPVLRAIAKKGTGTRADPAPPKACYDFKDLTAFQSAFIRRRETAILANLGFNKATIVAVYGAWLYGQLTVGALSQGGHKVALVVDSDPGKWGHLLAGHLIKDPQELKQRPEIQAVVVTSIGAFEPIQNHIRGMGLGELPIFSIAGGIIRKKHAG